MKAVYSTRVIITERQKSSIFTENVFLIEDVIVAEENNFSIYILVQHEKRSAPYINIIASLYNTLLIFVQFYKFLYHLLITSLP